MNIEERKNKHIEICISTNLESGDTWLDKVMLIPKTLPELSLKTIDTSTEFFEKKLDLPLMMGAITGGTETAKRINKALAAAAEKHKIAFSVGSQRAMIQDKKLTDTYKVRDVAPTTLVFGNIGATQAREISNKELQDALKEIGADALCIHINTIQEIFQENGDTDFENCIKAISRIAKEIPVFAKSVSTGFDRDTAIKLQGAGVKAIDICGTGGTNWIKADAIISRKEHSTFENWGIPTAATIIECRKTVPLIASGGIRTGMDMAKSIALGADMCSIALPFLKAWKNNSIDSYIEKLKTEFRMAMYLCGCKTVRDLKKTDFVLFDELKQYADQRTNYQQSIK